MTAGNTVLAPVSASSASGLACQESWRGRAWFARQTIP